MEVFENFIRTLMADSGYFFIMFIVAGVAMNAFTENLKKSLFPKYTEEEIANGKIQKDCPRWAGMLIGISILAIFSICSMTADFAGVKGCKIPGGVYWFFIWAVAFYFWQMAAMKAVKYFFTKVAPIYMTGKPREKKASKPVYQVPKGAKVEYVDGKVE